jgi:hypothetical protein
LCEASHQGSNPDVHNVWNKKNHSLRPIYSIEPTCGGRSLMYGVGLKHESRPELLPPHQDGTRVRGFSIFLYQRRFSFSIKESRGMVLPPLVDFLEQLPVMVALIISIYGVVIHLYHAGVAPND